MRESRTPKIKPAVRLPLGDELLNAATVECLGHEEVAL
jgi:hypothetical protein